MIQVHVETLAGIFVGVTWAMWAFACVHYRLKWLEEKKAREREAKRWRESNRDLERLVALYDQSSTDWKDRAYRFAEAVEDLRQEFGMTWDLEDEEDCD